MKDEATAGDSSLVYSKTRKQFHSLRRLSVISCMHAMCVCDPSI